MTNEETKLLTEVGVKLETVIKTMSDLTAKMDKLQETHVMEMNSRMAVAEEKIGRLEKIIYGLITVAVIELFALAVQYFQG